MPVRLLIKRFSFKKIIFSFFLVGILIIIFYLVFNQLVIKEIEIRANVSQSELNSLSILKNKNILFLDEKNIIKTLLKNNPKILSIQLEKKLPNKLILTLTLEKANYAIKADKGFFLINNQGKIIEKTKTIFKPLPLINFYQTFYFDYYSLGDLIESQEILTVLKIIEKVLNFGYKVNSVDINGRDMILLKIKAGDEEKNIYFSLEKKSEVQLYQLEFLLKQLKIKGQVFKEIDLRFDKPIIK